MHLAHKGALALATLAALGLAAAPVHAQNLVTNGDFETGDFTGFTVTGPSATVDANAGIGSSSAASFGASTPNVDSLSQTLATVAGQQYTLTFFALTPEFGTQGGTATGQPNSLMTTFDGNLVSALSVPDSDSFNQYSYTVTASTTSTTLAFFITNKPNFTQLDNISVTAAPAPAVPEPSPALTFAVAALGLGGLMVAAKRKKSTVA